MNDLAGAGHPDPVATEVSQAKQSVLPAVPVAEGTCTPDEGLKVEQLLDKVHVPATYEDAKLEDFTRTLATALGVDVQVGKDVDRTALINLDIAHLLKGEPKGRMVLDLVADQLDLGWYATGTGVVIDTRKEFRRHQATVTGPFVRRFDDGRLAARGYITKGKRTGDWSWWYRDGQLRTRGGYDKDGNEQGKWQEWDEHGGLVSESEYDHGAPDGTWTGYVAGQEVYVLEFRKGLADGRHRWWTDSGSLLMDAEFSKGKLVTPPSFYTDKGEDLLLVLDRMLADHELTRQRLAALLKPFKRVRAKYREWGSGDGTDAIEEFLGADVDEVADAVKALRG